MTLHHRRPGWAGPLLLAWLLLTSAGVHAAERWPDLPLPSSARRLALPEEMVINGRTVQTRLFESSERPAALTSWFRSLLGPAVVENVVGRRLVLGKLSGEFFVTVQLSAVRAGTQGVLSVTRLAQTSQERQQHAQDVQALLSSLPDGARVLQQISTREGDGTTQQWMLTSNHSERHNAELLRSGLQARGFDFQREATVPGQGRTLYFRGPAGEAMATVMAGSAYTTAILLSLQPRGAP